MPRRIRVVGMPGGAAGLGGPALEAVRSAGLVLGAPRHLEAVASLGARGEGQRVAPLPSPLEALLEEVAGEPGPVCVLASGDPGFFGVVRPLAERFGPEALEVHPGPASVSLAFARLGLPWDDAQVVSAHGRPPGEAAAAAARADKAAVLTSPECPPEALARRLVELGAGGRRAAVCSRLGLDGERVVVASVEEVAAGHWDPLSVLVVLASPGVGPGPRLSWSARDERAGFRDAMATKPEVRAVAVSKLCPEGAEVLWDVGAGSGMVGIECAKSSAGLAVFAVEPDPRAAGLVEANARSRGVAVEVVRGRAPQALAGLPDPDRVFVGGGGLEVLRACLDRLRPGGRLAATFAAMDRALAAHRLLGSLVQLDVAVAEPLPDGGLRLRGGNPVFLAWGPGGR